MNYALSGHPSPGPSPRGRESFHVPVLAHTTNKALGQIHIRVNNYGHAEWIERRDTNLTSLPATRYPPSLWFPLPVGEIFYASG